MGNHIGESPFVAQSQVNGESIAALLIFCKITGSFIKVFRSDCMLFVCNTLPKQPVTFMITQQFIDLQHALHRFDVKICIYKRCRNFHGI